MKETNKKYLLGADIGTTSLKCAVFDTEGHMIKSATKDYTLIVSGDEVEFPADDYVKLFKEAYDVVSGGLEISAFSIDTQCETLILTDENDEPLMNAIVWLDNRAAKEAEEVLGTTGDPQLSDFVLDRAYYREMLSAAEATRSDFLVRYVRSTIDAANLRSAVRTLRMRKGGDFLRKVLFEGGFVKTDSIVAAALGGKLEDPFYSTELRGAAALGALAVEGGSLTKFEKACDDAVTACAAKAKGVPFGVEAVIGYLVAKEIEFTAVRIIMSSRMAGISGDTIRERLREAYV